MDPEVFQKFVKFKTLCLKIIAMPKDLELFKEFKEMIQGFERSFLKMHETILLPCIFSHLALFKEKDGRLRSKDKLLIIETLDEALQKVDIKNALVLYNMSFFVLNEVFNINRGAVLDVTEEFKLASTRCLASLFQSASEEIVESVYEKEHVMKISQIVFFCTALIKKEKSKELRSAAIRCLCTVARVTDSDDFGDLVLREKIGFLFMFFLPGISSALGWIVKNDANLIGHKLLIDIIKAMGRLTSIVTQNYQASDRTTRTLQDLVAEATENERPVVWGSWTNYQEMNDYINSMKRTQTWYNDTDSKLKNIFELFSPLTYSDHPKVREAMLDMISEVVFKCYSTMPQSSCVLIELSIVLCQDSESNISTRSNQMIIDVSQKLSLDVLQGLFENLEDTFSNALNSLPRKFNHVDRKVKMGALSLIIGYIKLFDGEKINYVLFTPETLQKLIHTVLYISETIKPDTPILNEHFFADLKNDSEPTSTPWIKFRHFQEDEIKSKIEELCKELAKSQAFETVFDSLYDTFLYNTEWRKEAIFLLNAFVLGLQDPSPEEKNLLGTLLKLYTDVENNNSLCESLDSEEDHSTDNMRNNIATICLLTEGIGNISAVLKEDFKKYLLQSLYNVLEKAGDHITLIRTAGHQALIKITNSCGYSNITELINDNFDFFWFQLKRRLVKSQDKTHVLNVLSVVLTYCEKDVLVPMSDIINETLLLSSDSFKDRNTLAYLHVFKMFIASVRRWYSITTEDKPIKSRRQKQEEMEQFKVGGIDEKQDFSDDIMEGGTGEELYREDMEKKKQEEEQEEEEGNYNMGDQKQEPPIHIKLAASILRRILHFLPDKKKAIKCIALEILQSGIEILKDWEDELLPVVHKIWSPLVERIKENFDPLIMRLSVSLLLTLARLSGDFIRMRTTKEVLPKIKKTLHNQSFVSYMKDKGKPYRYSQEYKMQLVILDSIGPILAHLDANDKAFNEIMDEAYVYLSNKQPSDLQVASLRFFQTVINYAPELVLEKVTNWSKRTTEEYDVNISQIKRLTENKSAA